MPFAPRLSVSARLMLAIVVVVALSWLLGVVVMVQLIRLGFLRRGPGPPPPPPGISADSRRPGEEPPAIPERPEDRPENLAQAPSQPQPEPGGPPHRHRRPFWQDPRLIINLGVAVLVSAAAGIWVGRRFTRPLLALAEGASALRSGHLDHRIPVKSDDEFGRVAVSLNQLAGRIEEQIRELEADARRRQQVLADVAHELRSPVARLKAMAEALRDGVASSPERSERAVRTIADSAGRMERLVTDLLELARLDLEELPLHPQPVDLRAAAADALRRHVEAATGAGMTLRPMEPGEPVMVQADPHRLAQILDNLLDNAVSHAGTGAEVAVTVVADDLATLTVADTGRGVPAEHMPYLFDAFYRGDPARTPGDHHSGLGLRIARGLARAHGGDLEIVSEEGRGARAVLTWPSL